MKRFEELDSLRGIAALAVIISHGLVIFAVPSKVLELSPLYFFWASHEAVIFFFVLSGFVLTLPFLKRKISYSSYIIKRVIRIYFPYFVAILVTFISFFMFAKIGSKSVLGAWSETKWTEIPSQIDFLNHVFLIGNFETTTYNPVIWSLIHEMRISFIFPLIVLMIIKVKQIYVIGLGLGLSLIGCTNQLLGIQESLGYHTSLFDSLHYTLMFIIGALLAKNRDYLVAKYRGFKMGFKVGLLIIAFSFYLYSRVVYLIPRLLGETTLSSFMYGISDWGISIGAGMFIIIAISSDKISGLLTSKVLMLNGKLSFSTYLYHTTILLTMFSLLNGKVNDWLIFAISLVFTYFISYLSWRYIELPSISFGRKVVEKVNLKSVEVK